MSVWPCWAVPVIAGSTELTGASASTAAVAADAVGPPVPPALVALTWTSIVAPTSAAAST